MDQNFILSWYNTCQMLFSAQEKNIVNSVLATLLIHLVFIVIFLLIQLNTIQTKKEEQVIVEFDEEVYKMIKESMNQSNNDKNAESEGTSLSNQEIRNIAVNTATKLADEISTDKYISDVKNELGIKDNTEPQELVTDNVASAETDINNTKPVEKKQEVVYRGPSVLNYALENRTKVYMPVPAFKCRGAGIITIGITVNNSGEVINAIIESTTSEEECISETALEAARDSRFNSSSSADPKQKGSITYQYLAQ
jgi:hypothetical protein